MSLSGLGLWGAVSQQLSGNQNLPSPKARFRGGVQVMKSWLRTIDIVIIKYHLIMPLRTATPNLWQLVSAIGIRCTAEGVANLFFH